MAKIIPVILSGGSGTRLWPLSTDERPKQFLPLVSDRTMFAETLARVEDADRFTAPIVIGSEQHVALIEAELTGEKDRDARIILEPCARNTAPAIALAALAALGAGDTDAVVLVMPSDHVFGDVAAFQDAVEIALPAASDGWLVTFGITPTRADTGFGYIKMAQPLADRPDVRAVARFIEKPAQPAAEAMLHEGGHLWNAGIFLMRADRYLQELALYSPDISATCQQAMANVDPTTRLIRPDATAFAGCPSLSIDYAVMERSDSICVVPVSCGWSDVGSWDALAALAASDPAGNRLAGQVITLNTSNTWVNADGITVATTGVDDLVIVANKSFVMIMNKGHSQTVGQLRELINNKGQPSDVPS